jgi:hypothetical protein
MNKFSKRKIYSKISLFSSTPKQEKQMKNLTTNTTFNSKWIEFTYPLNNQIITKDLIKKV